MTYSSRLTRKGKQYKPKTKTVKQLRDLQRMKTLTAKTPVGQRPSKGKTKPPSVSAQFNVSVTFRRRCAVFTCGPHTCKIDTVAPVLAMGLPKYLVLSADNNIFLLIASLIDCFTE